MASASNEHHHPRRVLSRSVLMLVFLLFAFAAFFSWQSWRDARNERSSQLAIVADLGEKVFDSYFAQLETAMEGLGKDLAGTRGQINLGRAFTLVSQFQARHDELKSIILMRADGQLLLTGETPYSRELPSLANDPSFRKLRAGLEQAPSFVIGQPISGHIDNSWVIPARYGVTDEKGKLTHVITANLPVNLVQLYLADPAKLGATSFGLVRDDGYMISLYPEPDSARLNEAYGKPVAGAMAEYLRANAQSGQVVRASSAAADRSMQVMRRLQHYPLTLYAEMPVSEIRALWWRKVQVPYFLMLLMLAGIFTVRHWSYRRRIVWTQEQRREALRHAYEHSLLERSTNEIYMFDAGTLLFTYANDHALNSLGYSLEELQKRTFLSLHPEMGTETFSTLIAPLRRGSQETVKYQTTQERADGSTYPVEIALQLFTSAVRSGCLAIVNDITVLREAEENVRKFNAPIERRSRGRKPGGAGER